MSKDADGRRPSCLTCEPQTGIRAERSLTTSSPGCATRAVPKTCSCRSARSRSMPGRCPFGTQVVALEPAQLGLQAVAVLRGLESRNPLLRGRECDAEALFAESSSPEPCSDPGRYASQWATTRRMNHEAWTLVIRASARPNRFPCRAYSPRASTLFAVAAKSLYSDLVHHPSARPLRPRAFRSSSTTSNAE
jgi:hypothetical protein